MLVLAILHIRVGGLSSTSWPCPVMILCPERSNSFKLSCWTIDLKSRLGMGRGLEIFSFPLVQTSWPRGPCLTRTILKAHLSPQLSPALCFINALNLEITGTLVWKTLQSTWSNPLASLSSKLASLQTFPSFSTNGTPPIYMRWEISNREHFNLLPPNHAASSICTNALCLSHDVDEVTPSCAQHPFPSTLLRELTVQMAPYLHVFSFFHCTVSHPHSNIIKAKQSKMDVTPTFPSSYPLFTTLCNQTSWKISMLTIFISSLPTHSPPTLFC